MASIRFDDGYFGSGGFGGVTDPVTSGTSSQTPTFDTRGGANDGDPNPTPTPTPETPPPGSSTPTPPRTPAPTPTPSTTPPGQVPPNSTGNWWDSMSLRDAIATMYRNALGREGSDAELDGWANGPLRGNPAAIMQAIGNSPEAQAVAARRRAGETSGNRGTDTPSGLRNQILAHISAFAAAHPNANPSITRDPNYWADRIMQVHPDGNVDWGYWEGRMLQPEGPPEGATNPNSAGNGTSRVSGSALGYDDPSAMIYLNQLASRLNQLNTPQHDPWEDILKLFALQRVQSLNGAPYTSGDDAALIAHYRDPMTQARDQAKQQKAQDLARRGITPNSPLFQHEMSLIDQGYERGLATADNQLGVQAVQEKQRRADQQLSILDSILGVNRTGVDRSNALADRAVQVAGMFPAFDQQRLQMLLQASGEGAASPSSLISGLNSLGGLGLNSAIYQNGQDATSAAFWGNLIAGIMGGIR
jgi:hypothetical protein